MRRRRKPLQPDNFPFLAVLLCTMGSLILVLLALDRQARLAARERLHAAAVAAEQAEKEQADRLRAERQREIQAHLDRHRQERDALRQQERQLRDEEARLRARLAVLAGSLQEEQDAGSALVRRRDAEQTLIDRVRTDIAARQRRAVDATREVDTARVELERLTGDLLKLEQALERARKQKQAKQQTWSVVPYAGKRGRNSKPLYAECTARGVVFQPDGKTVAGPEIDADAVRAEARRRGAAPAGQEVYWLLLVRPDGIETYYRFLSAVKPLEVLYGYELIDSDWLLDFPEPASVGEAAPPLPAPRKVAVPTAGPLRPPSPQGGRGHPLPLSPSLVSPGGRGGPPQGGQGGTGEGPGPPPERVPARGAGAPAGGGTGEGGTDQAAPSGPNSNPAPAGPIGSGDPSATGPADGSGNPEPPVEVLPERTTREGGKGNSRRGSSEPLRPAARPGDSEWVLVIDCSARGVLISPSQVRIPLAELTAGAAGRARLLRTVQDLLVRRETARRPTDPPFRPLIRFLVQPDGLRTFHLAYPALDVLPVPKRTVMGEE